MRVGIGYDIHRLEEGRELILGGVQILTDTVLGLVLKVPSKEAPSDKCGDSPRYGHHGQYVHQHPALERHRAFLQEDADEYYSQKVCCARSKGEPSTPAYDTEAFVPIGS